ncbi:C40 family peptidase [Luteimonas pelagia]
MQANPKATRATHYPGPPRATATRARRAVVSVRPCAPAMRAAAFLAIGLLAGCGGGEVVRAPSPATSHAGGDWARVAPADPAAANAVLIRAIGLVGTPYRYGGNTPDGGFDCSGLVNFVFRDMLDLQLPRTSRALAAYQGPRVDARRLAPADLVFFGRGGQVFHVGIYVGEGRFVHAPSTGGTVRLDHLDGPYWRDHYTGARRVLD